jgi:type I restriction enzyme M protein
MSGKIAMALLDILRASSLMPREAPLPLLQLLAWDKLNRERPDLELPDLTYMADAVDCREQIRQGLNVLQYHPKLHDNARAFTTDHSSALRLMSELREAELRSILDLLREARPQPLNYPEMLHVLLSAVPMRELAYHLIPDEVADLMVRLARVSAHTSVYCPFAGSLKLAEWSNRMTRHVFVEAPEQSPLPFLLNLLTDGSLQTRIGDPIMQPGWVQEARLMRFDVSVAISPFGARYGTGPRRDLYGRFPEQALYGDVLHLRHILAHTKQRAVVLVAHGLLFRTAAGERDFKEYLIQARVLEAVIGLPATLLAVTNMPCALLVLNQEASAEDVLFVDAQAAHFIETGTGRRTLSDVEDLVRIVDNREERPFSRCVSHAELETHEYNLIPSRYVASAQQTRLDALLGKSQGVALQEIAEILRPQSLKNVIADDGVECCEVAAADIGTDGLIQQPQKRFCITPGALKKVRPLVLKPGDILLVVKGSIGKVGLISAIPDCIWLPNQSFQVIRLKDRTMLSDPVILLWFLRSPAGQALLAARAGGATVPMIQTHDVRTLPILVPSIHEQAVILQDHKAWLAIHAKIAQLQQEAEALSTKHWTL